MSMCWSAGMQLSWAVLALLALQAASESAPHQEAEWHQGPVEWRRAQPLSPRPLVQVFEHSTLDRRRTRPSWHQRALSYAHSKHMLRTSRSGRPYDVPQIECPSASDGMERFSCPTLDRQGRYRCIDDHVLCDGFIDCPNGEDEDRKHCMFFKTTKAHLDVLADALLRWVRGR